MSPSVPTSWIRRNRRRNSMKPALASAVLGALIVTHAWAQPAWKPEKQVEIVLPTAPGGGNDAVARLMAKVLQEQKLVTTPILVVNKPGGNQALSVTYLGQHP